jgi:hypothetical protein
MLIFVDKELTECINVEHDVMNVEKTLKLNHSSIPATLPCSDRVTDSELFVTSAVTGEDLFVYCKLKTYITCSITALVI